MISKFKKSSILAILAILSTATIGLATETEKLTAADIKIVKRELNASMENLGVARIGVKQAKLPGVKTLADTLVTDHSTANTELQTFAAANGVDINSVIGEATSKKIQKLEAAQGEGFDEKFLAHVISSRKDCISALEKNDKGPKNAELKTWTDKFLVTLKSHLTTAESLTAK